MRIAVSRAPGTERVVTPLELFFDLVYVFAIGQLSHHLLEHVDLRTGAETDPGSNRGHHDFQTALRTTPTTNEPPASGWRTRLPSAPRATASEQRALSRRSGRTTGISCVQVADPDGYRVEVYAHCWRHDVEKRRPASLIR
jgi:hypothetical protein